MHNEFTALIEPDGEWFAAYCGEVPEGNGQGRSPAEAKQNLAGAIALVGQDRRADGHELRCGWGKRDDGERERRDDAHR